MLFPSFAVNNRERLVSLAADFRKAWSNWRNNLWKKLLFRYNRYVKYLNNTSEAESPSSYLKCTYIIQIFDTWLKFVSSHLSKENETVLRNLVVFGFYCLKKHPNDASNKFFSTTGNLYTVNCDFQSAYNIATSMELSVYDIVISGNQSSDSSADEEGSKKRKKSISK